MIFQPPGKQFTTRPIHTSNKTCIWNVYILGWKTLLLGTPEQRVAKADPDHKVRFPDICVRSGRATPIARFMGPTWGQFGADRTQVGPMLAPWTLLSGISTIVRLYHRSYLVCWSYLHRSCIKRFQFASYKHKLCLVSEIRHGGEFFFTCSSFHGDCFGITIVHRSNTHHTGVAVTCNDDRTTQRTITSSSGFGFYF